MTSSGVPYLQLAEEPQEPEEAVPAQATPGERLTTPMRLDHVSYAAGPEGLVACADRISRALGVPVLDGGYHPAVGTRNKILPLCDGRFVEIVEVLEHPAAEKVPFGQVVRTRSAQGGGWMCWVVSAENMENVETRLQREAVEGSRRRPDGVELLWRQIGVRGIIADPQLPFIINWLGSPDLHPSREGRLNGVHMAKITIAGDPDRVRSWLGGEQEFGTDGVEYDFIAPHGTPGLMSVTFNTARGPVEV